MFTHTSTHTHTHARASLLLNSLVLFLAEGNVHRLCLHRKKDSLSLSAFSCCKFYFHFAATHTARASSLLVNVSNYGYRRKRELLRLSGLFVCRRSFGRSTCIFFYSLRLQLLSIGRGREDDMIRTWHTPQLCQHNSLRKEAERERTQQWVTPCGYPYPAAEAVMERFDNYWISCVPQPHFTPIGDHVGEGEDLRTNTNQDLWVQYTPRR